MEPDVPVIVIVLFPMLAELLALNVSAEPPVVGLVPNDAVTPAGSPLTARFTLPAKPYWLLNDT
jgi:hypothetical protein